MSKILPCRITPPNAIIPYLHRWQSNNSANNLGIKNFIFDLYEINRQMGYPDLIRDFNPSYGIAPWAAKSLSEYFEWEEGMTKEDRCFFILTYREGSKRQPLDAKILTPTGYKLMGEIKVGDLVIGSDGRPTEVEFVSEIVDRPVYQLKTEDGRITECDGEHLWNVRKMHNNRKSKHTIICTDAMLNSGLFYDRVEKRSNNKRFKEYKYALETVKPVELQERDLPLEPYLLGLILGDGSVDKKWGVTKLFFHKDDGDFYREQIKNYSLSDTIYDKRNDNVGRIYVHMIGKAMRELGLNVNCYNKFIPNDYLYGSIGQRKALLEGLMDTDGNVGGLNGQCSRYVSVSEKLVDGVIHLVRSLGGRATKSSRVDKLGFKSFGVSILFTDYIPFRLPRKKNKCRTTAHTFSRIVSIDLVGNKLGRCIKISNEDGLYVTDDFILTHNTSWYSRFLPLYETLVGQYGIYHNNSLFPEVDYQVLRSKNNREAQKHIMFISSFLNKPLIRRLFGELKPSFKEVREKEAKDTGTLMILNNGYIFECSGIDQPSRGLNILSVRPKKILFDDVQNRENTKTPERRASIDREVMEESFGAVADQGSMVYICNRVHPADTAGKLGDRKNTVWRKSIYTISMVQKPDGTLAPGVGDLKNEVPEWSARWTMQQIDKRIKWFIAQPDMGGVAGALKNYYNIIKSDANYKVKYYIAEYHREHGINWLVFNENGKKVYKNVFIVLGLDPAISEAKKACDSAIVVIAVDSDRNRYILEQKFGKWDIRDRFLDDNIKPKRDFAITHEEMTNVKRIGSAHEVARLAFKYHAEAIDIEARVATQMTFYNEAKIALDAIGWKGVLRPEPSPSEGKIEKLKQTPLIYYEAGLYWLPGIIDHNGDLQPREDVIELKNDVIAFPDCAKDRLDSQYLAEQVITYPQHIEYDPLGNYNLRTEKYTNSDESGNIYKSGSVLNAHEDWIIL